MKQFIRNQYINQRNLLKLWKDIKESVKGTTQDFTKGKLSRALILLAIPMVLEMLMESVFAVVDIFFVSKIGPEAVATVGITEAMITIIYALSLGLAMATTAVVSRRIGEKRPEMAAKAATQAIIISITISMVITLVGIFFNRGLLKLMGATKDMIQNCHGYTGILIGTNLVIMLLFVINAVFRSAGDAAISMRVLWLANIINIILDPCLIFGWGPFPELGIKGAAIATSIGRGIAVCYQLWLIFRGKSRIKICFSQFKPDFKIIKKILKLARGSIGQYLITTTSWIALVRIIAVFGSHVLAGYTIAIRIIIFSILPGWGLSNAAATLVGQNLGANKEDRAQRSVWISGFANMVILGFFGILFLWQAEFFIKIFTTDPIILQHGAECLRIISYGFLAYGLGMVLTQAFNGAGDTHTPLKINFFCFWLFEIPLAWFLSIFLKIGANGAYIAIVCADTALVLISMYFFFKGKWKTKVV